MYARFSDPVSNLLLQPPAQPPEGPRPVGVPVLVLAHLRVGEIDSPAARRSGPTRTPPPPSAPARSRPRTSPSNTRTSRPPRRPPLRRRPGADRSSPASIRRMPSLPTLARNHLVSAPGSRSRPRRRARSPRRGRARRRPERLRGRRGPCGWRPRRSRSGLDLGHLVGSQSGHLELDARVSPAPRGACSRWWSRRRPSWRASLQPLCSL